MTEFCAETGIGSTSRDRRYLWTDAFAVCNLLGLWRKTGQDLYRGLALELVGRVHYALGRHRPDDPREGWISGLEDAEGEDHPTAGGLRIGKAQKERQPGEPLDPQEEWERDGQYYHYLTKWMHALLRVAQETGEPTFHIWSLELAKAAHAGFVRVDDAGRPVGLAWKMSIDMSRPLVPGMGQHDPLDGLITLQTLQTGSKRVGSPPSLDLSSEIEELKEICRGMSWETDDPLGAGGLLMDACRLSLLGEGGQAERIELLEAVIDTAVASVEAFSRKKTLALPADYRLAFREFGLSIGLGAVERTSKRMETAQRRTPRLSKAASRFEALRRLLPLRDEIHHFWTDPKHRKVETWTAHRDINTVMLATSLDPAGFFGRPL